MSWPWPMSQYEQLPTVGGVLEGCPPDEPISIVHGKEIIDVGVAAAYIEEHRRDAILMKKVYRKEISQFSTFLHIKEEL